MKRDFFSFDNLGEEFSSLGKELRRGTPTAVFGVSDSLKYLLAGLVDSPVVYITTDRATAGKIAQNIQAFSGKRVHTLLAKDEVLLYRKALSKDALYNRLCGIHALQTDGEIIVAEIDALIQLFPKKLPVITLREGEEYDFLSLPEKLVSLGYTRSFEVECKGAFALRGDILDIYPINAENPVRIDFFEDTIEKIKPYDFVSGNRLAGIKEITILSATDTVVAPEDRKTVKDTLEREVKRFKTSESYTRAKEIADEILLDESLQSSFILPLLENTTDFFSVVPENATLIFDEGKALWDKFNALYKEHEERFHRLQAGGEAFDFTARQYLPKQSFLDGVAHSKRVALQTFKGNPFFFEPLKIYNLSATDRKSVV